MPSLMHKGIACLSTLLFGCAGAEVNAPEASLTGGEHLGVLELYSEAAGLSIPDSARVGSLIPVTVETFGGALQNEKQEVLCVRKGSTKVTAGNQGVEITPLDLSRQPGPESSCTLLGVRLQHQAVIRADSAGKLLVRIHGLRIPENEHVVLERTVTVY